MTDPHHPRPKDPRLFDGPRIHSPPFFDSPQDPDSIDSSQDLDRTAIAFGPVHYDSSGGKEVDSPVKKGGKILYRNNLPD
jgi:hypothetical protein